MVAITKPTVGSDTDTWGTKLNTALDTLASAVTTLEGSGGGGGTGGIPTNTVTTAGDLIVGTGAGTVTRLAKGIGGFSLQSQNSGVVWGIQSGSLIAKLRQTTTVSLAVSTWTNLAFQTADFDGMGAFVSGSTGYAPGLTGWYEISGGVSFTNSPNGGARACCFTLNGTQLPASATSQTHNANVIGESMTARTTAVQLTSGSDSIGMQAWQSSSATLSTYATLPYGSYLFVRWLGY